MKNRIKKEYAKNQEIINYIIVGGLTTIISLGVYYGLVFTIINPKDGVMLQLANVISWVAAVTFAYFTNRIFVFKSKNSNMLNEGVKFYCSRIFTLFVDMFFMFLLVTLLNFDDKISKIAVQFIVLICNYVISKFIVFNKKGVKYGKR